MSLHTPMTPVGAEKPSKTNAALMPDRSWQWLIWTCALEATSCNANHALGEELLLILYFFSASSLHCSFSPLITILQHTLPSASSSSPFFSHPSTPPYFLSPLIFSPNPAPVLRGCNDRLWNKGGVMVTLIMMMVVMAKWRLWLWGAGPVSVDSPCLSWHQSGNRLKAEFGHFLYFLWSRPVRSTLQDSPSTQCAAGYTGACVGSEQALSKLPLVGDMKALSLAAPKDSYISRGA